jgi:hypothetical protein
MTYIVAIMKATPEHIFLFALIAATLLAIIVAPFMVH